MGYGIFKGDVADEYWYCVNASCSVAPAAVPELEDYAAVAFLILALTIGWQVRRSHVSAG